jgi:biotin/methionine sulfoxide reductase
MPVRTPSLAHWGAFSAVVEGGRVIGCEPFARDAAPSAMLASIPAMVHSPLRVARPAIREGWREGRPRTGHDAFREVSWDEALDAVAGELARVRRDHGPEAIFGGSYGWSSAGRVHHARTLVRRFLFLGGGCVDQIGNYSWGAAQVLLPHVIGSYLPVTGRVTDWASLVGHTRTLLAFGGIPLRNTQVTSGGAGTHPLAGWLGKARAAGMKFVVVSPQRSDVPDDVEAEWIPIRPNTDTALMLALASELLAEGRHDADFLARYCVGFPEFAAYLRGERDGVAKTPAWAASICGIDAGVIRALARRLAAERSFITCAWSLQRAHHGEQPYWAAITLAAMLGGIGLPGGGFGFGHGSMNGAGAPRIDLPAPEWATPPNPARRGIPVARIADMLLDPGGAYEFNGRHETYPDIRLIYWAGGNPFHHHQDINRLRAGWQKPDTIIVHESLWTPTARHADIVLPATTTLERNDIGGSSRDPFVLAMHQAIPPVGEARDDYEIFRALAARLGFEQAFSEGRSDLDWCAVIYGRLAETARARGIDLPSFEAFWQAGFVELPPPQRDFVLFEEFRADPDAHPLKTPSGRIEIVSSTIAAFGYGDCPPHPAWLPPVEWLGAAEAARHPLHLVTHQPASRLHSQLDPAPLSRGGKVAGREPVRLHPDEARRRGLQDGDVVRLFNARGACLAGLVVDHAVMPGVAAMATGAWFDPAEEAGAPERHGNPNVLTLDLGTSRLAQGPSALSALVEIARWTGNDSAVGVFEKPRLTAG